uniref:LPS assembly lipoprotein LptE n=1 Tax=Candidatus Electronema sp. TaxID=2698783 RepID=UPI004055F88B
MNRISPILLSFFGFLLLLGGCAGYYFPNVYDGPEVAIYMPTWGNRTDKLGIDSTMYNSLSEWFLKSDKINLTKEKEGADLILAGEIISINLPGIGWSGEARTTDVKVELTLRYVLKDLRNGKIIWEAPQEVWTEDYNTLARQASSEDEAVEHILDDVSEKIYLGTISRIRRLSRQN